MTMSFWESNSAIIDRLYPGLLGEICAAPDLDPCDIQVETSAAGSPSLKIKGVYVHSPRDPAREGRRLAESMAREDGPVIILGFGLGYAAEAACELWPRRPLIIVEKYKTILRRAFEERDLKTLLERKNIIFVPGGTGEGVTNALSLLEKNTDTTDAPVVMRNRPLTGIDGEWYAAVDERIRTWNTRAHVNTATLNRFGKRWVRNLSRNMAAIRDIPGIARLASLASDTPVSRNADSGEALPVFLAAAGPGLDEIRPFLTAVRRRCIVVAVDTSLRFLARHGVIPDFTVTVDPQFWNSRHLDFCPVEQTRLVAESAVYPEILRLPFREKYLCGSLFPLGSFIEKRVDPKGELGAGGSVATTAWDFARALGSREIWIAGLDLAFPRFKTHFHGAAFEERSHSLSRRASPAETWLVRALRDGLPFRAPSAAGAHVLTDRRLSLYAAWFENRFRQYPAVRNYSLSAKGLAIAGLASADTDALLALPERRDEIDRRLADAAARIENDFFDTEETRTRAKRFADAARVLLRGLTGIKTAAAEGAAIAERALKRKPEKNEQNKILKNLDRIIRDIAESEVKEVAGFLFPQTLEAADNSGDPFRAYLETQAKLCRALAETVDFNLSELEKFAR